jgi:type IV pilus assembly protein PilB
MPVSNNSSRNNVPGLVISILVLSIGLAFGVVVGEIPTHTIIGQIHTYVSHPAAVTVLTILLALTMIATLSAIVQALKAKHDAKDRLRQRHEDIVKPIRVYDLGDDYATIGPVRLSEVPGRIAQLCRRGEKCVPDLVDCIICNAILTRSSDIHLEPASQIAAIKYRQDGILNDVGQIPRDLMVRLSSRLRVLANLTIYEKGKPQDGRIEVKWNKKIYDVRVSFLPTLHGDKVVIRLFDSGEHEFSLVKLGLSEDQFEQVTGFLLKPQGTIILTGPTGSGKTTTIYSSIRFILHKRGETTNIVTIEDPIEREVTGVNQTQVNPKRELTFASGLRSILRQDPDVIVVGEVRDRETAEICTQAGLTGHLVISTIHADSAVGVFNRLIEMGIEPFLVASSIIGIVSQRLLKRNCPHCLIPVVPSLQTLKILGVDVNETIRFVRGRGCEKCDYKGYKGRIGVFEILQPSERLREALQAKKSTGELHRIAIEDRMLTLLDDGLLKVKSGAVDVEELVRILV